MKKKRRQREEKEKKERGRKERERTSGKELFSGPQVSLLQHLDSPCFGGKHALTRLFRKYQKVALGDMNAQKELRALADAGNTAMDAHAQYMWGKILVIGSNIRGARIVPESDACAREYWTKAAAHGHVYATDGLGNIAQRRGAWIEATAQWKKALQLCLIPISA